MGPKLAKVSACYQTRFITTQLSPAVVARVNHFIAPRTASSINMTVCEVDINMCVFLTPTCRHSIGVNSTIPLSGVNSRFLAPSRFPAYFAAGVGSISSWKKCVPCATLLSVKWNSDDFFFFLLLAVCTPHAEYYILFWRGVRGCLNNFSGCYCKILKL